MISKGDSEMIVMLDVVKMNSVIIDVNALVYRPY